MIPHKKCVECSLFDVDKFSLSKIITFDNANNHLYNRYAIPLYNHENNKCLPNLIFQTNQILLTSSDCTNILDENFLNLELDPVNENCTEVLDMFSKLENKMSSLQTCEYIFGLSMNSLKAKPKFISNIVYSSSKDRYFLPIKFRKNILNNTLTTKVFIKYNSEIKKETKSYRIAINNIDGLRNYLQPLTKIRIVCEIEKLWIDPYINKFTPVNIAEPNCYGFFLRLLQLEIELPSPILENIKSKPVDNIIKNIQSIVNKENELSNDEDYIILN